MSSNRPTLQLYNTLTRKKAPFEPIDANNVRMYVCGPTVYDFAHIGNARPVIVFDVLFRLLRHLYGADHVTYVRNITDVDDKINDRAARDFPGLPLNDAIRRVTESTANQYMADVKALGCLEPTEQPRATDNITQMIAIIETLIARGNAYVAAGEVLFSVTSMPDYGALSNRKLDDQQAGARVAVEAHKRNPGDFVLWKLSSENEPGWDSPWGRGRPGWHIECSAMSNRYLGETFDIHGGGLDLIFPHHENEIAQSRCAFGHDVMANVWMHNGFLQVEGEKMSKSVGNFVTINELLQRHPGDTIRFQMLLTHYRQPIDWTDHRLRLAQEELCDWASVLQGYFDMKFDGDLDSGVVSALADDLNTPSAISSLRALYNIAKNGSLDAKRSFAANCKLLGFQNLGKPGLFNSGVSALNVGEDALHANHDNVQKFQAALANNLPTEAISVLIQATGVSLRIDPGSYITLVGKKHLSDQEIDSLIAARLAARTAKNFAESDRIRDELVAMGIQIMDSKDPVTGELKTTWEVKR